MNKPNVRIFPGKFPSVENEDGTNSNVKIGTFTFGEGDKQKHLLIPTMVDGKQLSNDDAVNLAKSNGIDRYPSFNSQAEADQYAEVIHSKINESGFLTK
jgi:hypothetical protein